MSRPNIVFISTHDINPHLGAYAGVWPGAEQAVTPNLDRLAAEGARFDRAFAAAPVCAPSRSAIMTGRYPIAIGTMHMRTSAVPPEDVVLFPQLLREAGYYTTNNWFTDFQMELPPTVFDAVGPEAHWRGRPSPETPFFAAFHGMTTHESQIYLDDEAFAAATTNVRDDQRHDPARVALPPYYPDTAVFRRSWARYLDLITEMDHWVGTILDDLESDGLADDTIVVFWSDHGLGMPRAKRWANESGVREPLLIRWPGVVEPRTERSDVVQLLDLAPTLIAAAGIDVPDTLDGRVLVARDGKVPARPRYAFAARDRMDEQVDASRTVRDERFRYIRHLHPDRSPMQHAAYPDALETWAELRRLAFDEAGQLAEGRQPDILTPLQRAILASCKPAEELYDVEADPFETRDLIDDPACAGDLERLRGALDDWLARTGDLGAVPEESLLERWRPHGCAPRVATPEASIVNGMLVAFCETPGAVVAWTDELEQPSGAPALPRAIGGVTDSRHWRLISAPVPPGRTIRVRAWRLGWEPSVEIEVAAEVESVAVS